MKFSIFILLVIPAAVSAIAIDNTSDTRWEDFKTTFNKKYFSYRQEQKRRAVFEENLEKINNHNFEADLGKHRFRLGVNQFADLTTAEYRRLLLGFRPNTKSSGTSGSGFLAPANVKLPEEVDWRKHGYVTKVKDQGFCGSCWAFSATGSLEGQHFRKTGKLVSLSEQQLVDCSRKFHNYGCNGGDFDDAFKYIKAAGGIDSEKSYPYKEKNGSCHFQRKDVVATVSGYIDVTPNEEALKLAVATIGPISVALDASHLSFQFYVDGVYDVKECKTKISELDHAVLVVGYGRTGGDKAEDFWIIKNSWGPYWGIKGYMLLRRNHSNMCGVASLPSYPLV